MPDSTFLSRFYTTLEVYLSQTAVAARNNDLTNAQKLGHKMLGLCQMFGTAEQVTLCEILENVQSLSSLIHTLERLNSQIEGDKQRS
ncbi:Hpt domain-containing protein [Enterobacter mori]|uniref:Hpt domain-containing protein n=1 Tax=Enterobacter mori TaxID=539813 RepID=UPI001B8D3464|nr:Hpt domain-containing protein [Enterobacter mori]